jgi:hypothetical protein
MKALALAVLAAPLAPVAPVTVTPDRPSLLAPSALSAPALMPALSPVLSAPAAPDKPVEHQAAQAGALFDGWKQGSFEGDGGVPVSYKSREGGDGPARVYSGGLALNESFEPVFARPGKPAGPELFLWTRGHPPSAWAPTKNPIDADARDLAAAVNLAAKTSPGGKVELALHSFGTLVFQRMIQLHEEPAVKAALAALKDSRVFLLHATTHFEGSERRAGPDFERMGQATRAVVDWLDAGDAMAAWWGPAAFSWNMMRGQVIAAAAKEAAAMMKKDLSEPWPAFDSIRKRFLKDLARDARDPAWQESMLRRSSDMFRLEFSPADAARIKALGIKLELVHSDGDALLNWESALTLFERLGIRAPKKAPPAGTVLTDESGRFRARIVSGDHYWPLKKPGELAELMK